MIRLRRWGVGPVLLCALWTRHARADAVFGLSFSIASERGERVVDDAWVERQIDEANALFSPLGTRFRWTMERDLAEPHGEMHSRADRDALTPLTTSGLIDVFLVRELEDVDEPGRRRMGVCWTGLGGKRLIVLSRIARPKVLAHELGHFFGNPHTKVVNNLMSYARDGGVVFLDETQQARIRRLSARFLDTGRLIDVGTTWRMF